MWSLHRGVNGQHSTPPADASRHTHRVTAPLPESSLQEGAPQRLRVNHYSLMSVERFIRHHGAQFGSVSGITGAGEHHKDAVYFADLDARAQTEDAGLKERATVAQVEVHAHL